MDKADYVLLQKNILENNEGECVLLQSNYYPIGEGSLYVFKYKNTYITKIHGRDPHVIIDLIRETGYKRHALKPGKFEGELTHWREMRSDREGVCFPIRLEDRLFVLGVEENIDKKILKLPRAPKEFTIDDLTGQFPNARQIWPAEG